MRNIIIIDMQKGFIKETNCHLIEKINNYLKENIFEIKQYNKYFKK